MQGGDDGAVGDVEGGEQAGGARAHVVVGAFLGHAGHHRERRLAARQRLDLGLLVHAQHHRGLGRVQVEPDDVIDLLHEQRVVGQLEVLAAMRLQLKGLPDPPDRGLGQPAALGHRFARPVRGVGGGGFQRGHHHVLDLLGGHRRRPARPRVVDQPVAAAPRRTGAATSRPSAAPPAPAPRPPCSTGPRRSPARSATATPAPANSYAAAPTASASGAPPRSTPAPPSAAHVMPYANHPTRQHDSPRNTADAHRLQLCNEFQAQDTSTPNASTLSDIAVGKYHQFSWDPPTVRVYRTSTPCLLGPL